VYSTEPTKLPILLFVGRPLDVNKGMVTFLDAIEVLLLLPTSPKFQVWIVGGEEAEIKYLLEMASARPTLVPEISQGRFVLWGKVDRAALPAFYRNCHVVVMPSVREPFGLVAIEAMACGVPVVGSDIGGISDTVLPGITGSTTESDQPIALAAALLFYLRSENITNVRGSAAKSWSVSSFNRDATYRQMADLYETENIPHLENFDWQLKAHFDAKYLASKM
jgi:D-inositol-3-phosphate glycosyltransferase